MDTNASVKTSGHKAPPILGNFHINYASSRYRVQKGTIRSLSIKDIVSNSLVFFFTTLVLNPKEYQLVASTRYNMFSVRKPDTARYLTQMASEDLHQLSCLKMVIATPLELAFFLFNLFARDPRYATIGFHIRSSRSPPHTKSFESSGDQMQEV